jgi:hypothetical protein
MTTIVRNMQICSLCSDLKFIKITLYRLAFPALIDTGCSRICIRSDVLKLISTLVNKQQPSNITLKCANSETVTVTTLTSPIAATVQTSSLPLKIKLNPLIVQNLSCQIILVMDVLQKNDRRKLSNSPKQNNSDNQPTYIRHASYRNHRDRQRLRRRKREVRPIHKETI